MQKEQLEKIIRSCAKYRHAITRLRPMIKNILDDGYKDARRLKNFKNFPIAKIVKGAEQSTEWVQSHDGLHEFKGSIFTGVDGAEGVEFVILQVNQINKEKDISMPWQMFVFVKANAEGVKVKTEQEEGEKKDA